MSKKPIKLFAGAWSPPAWMKENKKFNGKGGILKEMIQPFTEYILK